jgi:hypothetical protein
VVNANPLSSVTAVMQRWESKWSQEHKKPRRKAGLIFRSEGYLGFEFTFQDSSQPDQAGSHQGKTARFRHNEVGIAARDVGRTIEEAGVGVDRQLDRGTVNRVAATHPGARKGALQGVIVSSVGQRHQSPSHGTVEASVE